MYAATRKSSPKRVGQVANSSSIGKITTECGMADEAEPSSYTNQPPISSKGRFEATNWSGRDIAVRVCGDGGAAIVE